MGGLPRELVPIPFTGGLDLKTDPKLIQPGAVIEAENCWRDRNGEWRKRFGSSVLPTTAISGISVGNVNVSAGDPFLGKFGNQLCLMLPGPGPFLWTFDISMNKWAFTKTFRPDFLTPRVVSGFAVAPDTTATENTTADAAILNGFELAAWEVASAGTIAFSVIDAAAGGAPVTAGTISTAVRPKVVAAGNFLCILYVDTSASPRNIKVAVYNTTAMTTLPTTYTVQAGTGIASGSEPYLDAYVAPGGSTAFVAWRNNSGGASVSEFNPSSGTNTVGPNAIVADCNNALGWIGDDAGAGYSTARYLGSAGTTNAVRVLTLNTSLAVTSTFTAPASEVNNVRNVTGYLDPDDGGASFWVFWEVAGTSALNNFIRYAVSSGGASQTLRRGCGLATKPMLGFGASGGFNTYSVGVSFDTATQAGYFILSTPDQSESSVFGAPLTPVLYGEGGGHTAKSSHLPGISRSSSSPFQAVTACLQKVKIQADNGTFYTVRAARILEISQHTTSGGVPRSTGPTKEIGGLMCVPGGELKVFDGVSFGEACPLMAPETPTLTASAGGSLTASSTYRYIAVYRWVTGNGRVQWGPPSVSTPITLGAGQTRVTVDIPTLRLTSGAWTVKVELYRTEANLTTYYLVGSVANSTTVDTVQIVDTTDDTTLTTGALLYTNGKVLDNFNPPAFTAIEVYRNRLWGINAETRTEVRASKMWKPGIGFGFNPNLAVRLDTSDGDIYALATLDDKLCFFKRSSIYALASDGPSDVGAGDWDTPVLLSNQQGTINPRSVIATPGGLFFEGARGIWLLGRDGSASFAGAPVQSYFTGGGTDVTGAVHMPDYQQVRFTFAGGRTLVYDYAQRQWMTFTGQPAGHAITVGSTVYWVHPTTDVVSKETVGSYGDNGTGYAMRLVTPWLQLAGLAGFQRVKRLELLGENVGSHTLKISTYLNLSASVAFAAKTLAGATAWPQPEMRFDVQRCSSAQLAIEESAANTGAGFRLTAASLLVAIKQGVLRPMPSANRLT
jgi:hypothetical protein